MTTKVLRFSFLFLLFSFCSSSPASAQITDLPAGPLGGQFRDDSTGKVWLDVSAFRGSTYGSFTSALAMSPFRLATRGEFEELLQSVSAINRAMGLPATDGESARFSGPYDDSATGSDPRKLGNGRVLEKACSPATIPDCGYSESVIDDVFEYTSDSIISGAWVVQRIATSCAAGGHHQDFDCDGADEKVVWRPNTGMFFVRFGNSQFFAEQWGLPGDLPIIGDYDGDGVPDLVVWRPLNGTWYVKTSSSLYNADQAVVQQFGLPGDKPMRADYDGDGVLDFAVWRPAEGNFYYRKSSNGEIVVEQWGLPGDIPIVSAADKS